MLLLTTLIMGQSLTRTSILWERAKTIKTSTIERTPLIIRSKLPPHSLNLTLTSCPVRHNLALPSICRPQQCLLFPDPRLDDQTFALDQLLILMKIMVCPYQLFVASNKIIFRPR